MSAFVLVCFAEPVPAGLVFPRSKWRLHLTVLRFDTRESNEAICGRLGAVLPKLLGFEVRIGADALFGKDGSVPVSLVETGQRMQALHEGALDAVGPRVHLPGARHVGSNYRPHVTHAGQQRLHPADRLLLCQAALVDMRPDNDPRLRRVVAVWEAEGAGPHPGPKAWS